MSDLSTITVNKVEFAELIDALSFYADEMSYFAIGFIPDPPCGDFIEDFENLGDEEFPMFKPGKRAREVLRIFLDSGNNIEALDFLDSLDDEK